MADLGGEETSSAQQRTVIELAGRTRFLLNGIDAWLIQQPSLVNKSKRRLFDVVRAARRYEGITHEVSSSSTR